MSTYQILIIYLFYLFVRAFMGISEIRPIVRLFIDVLKEYRLHFYVHLVCISENSFVSVGFKTLMMDDRTHIPQPNLYPGYQDY